LFFVLSKIFGYLFYPLNVFFLSLLAFTLLLKRRPRAAWGCLWFGASFLYIAATPWGSDLLLLPLERPYQNPPRPVQADVIVVLGGALDLTNSLPGRLEYNDPADRFIYGVHLAHEFPQAILLFAGGTASLTGDPKTEASMLKGEAVRLGVRPERIRVDDRSRNTHENALQAKRLLQDEGRQSVVLVTSAFHMRRSLGCLRKVGLEATPYAVDVRNHWGGGLDPFGWVPQSSRLDTGTAAVREYVGLIVYRLKGYI
jgi:uncharacterized SAM-binding protein YcdF (DUF218 family)